MQTFIPCKRPKVTVTESPEHPGLYIHACHVPGCGWTTRTVKTDHLGAPDHRRRHRAAVPGFTTTDVGIYIIVRCSCGHEHRVHGTKRDVAAHIEHHQTTEHGLVVC